jgi:hypothetical protein
MLPNPFSKEYGLLLIHHTISKNTGTDTGQLIDCLGLIVIPCRAEHPEGLSVGIFGDGELVDAHSDSKQVSLRRRLRVFRSSEHCKKLFLIQNFYAQFLCFIQF